MFSFRKWRVEAVQYRFIAQIMIDLYYTGSFQRGIFFTSEDPLDEAWARVARFGASDYVRAEVIPENETLDWELIVSYSVVRIRQASEFWRASRNASLLTALLPLYYSFLNLTRAFLAIDTGIMSSKGHGLSIDLHDNLLTSRARIKKGTFKEYLAARGINLSDDFNISLDDCLSRIIELHYDYTTFKRQPSHVIPVVVSGMMTSGNIYLRFEDNHITVEDFRNNWSTYFPSLSSSCVLEEGCVLKAKEPVGAESREKIIEFLEKYLEGSLICNDHNRVWYAVRVTNSKFMLPRPAYYFCAMFILGNIVRYQPELLLQVMQPDSQLGWFLERFIKTSERFYPQLMLMWLYKQNIFF